MRRAGSETLVCIGDRGEPAAAKSGPSASAGFVPAPCLTAKAVSKSHVQGGRRLWTPHKEAKNRTEHLLIIESSLAGGRPLWTP